MKTLNNVILTVQNKGKAAMQTFTQKMMEKKYGGAGTVAALILIVIIVGILITFKTTITGWVTDLTSRIGGALSKFQPPTA